MRLESAGTLASRFLLSAIFISGGIAKFRDPQGTAEYMKANDVPFIPVSRPLAGALEIGAGAGLLSGLKGRLSATALFLYLIPTTFFFHRFWAKQGQEKQMQQVEFFKNLAIMGGLLDFAARGSGRLSVTRPERDRLLPGRTGDQARAA